MWKDRIRPWIQPLPQWSVVAIVPPQRAIAAILYAAGQTVDVTRDHTVAALRPLVLATSLDAGARPVLEYVDRATGSLLGVLRLAKLTRIAAADAPLTLYRVAGAEHHCLGWPRRPWNAWLQNRRMRRHAASHPSLMAPAAVQQLMVVYVCPRPVVLVSVSTPAHRNIFPMDLVGPLQRSGLFALALRSTNVSVPVMRDARRVALSSVPATLRGLAYELAAHHAQGLTDWNALPCPVQASREFGIPVPTAALRVRELAIVHSEEVGSHTLFLGRIVSDAALADDAQLHHTAGFHQAWRQRRGRGFTEV